MQSNVTIPIIEEIPEPPTPTEEEKKRTSEDTAKYLQSIHREAIQRGSIDNAPTAEDFAKYYVKEKKSSYYFHNNFIFGKKCKPIAERDERFHLTLNDKQSFEARLQGTDKFKGDAYDLAIVSEQTFSDAFENKESEPCNRPLIRRPALTRKSNGDYKIIRSDDSGNWNVTTIKHDDIKTFTDDDFSKCPTTRFVTSDRSDFKVLGHRPIKAAVKGEFKDRDLLHYLYQKGLEKDKYHGEFGRIQIHYSNNNTRCALIIKSDFSLYTINQLRSLIQRENCRVIGVTHDNRKLDDDDISRSGIIFEWTAELNAKLAKAKAERCYRVIHDEKSFRSFVPVPTEKIYTFGFDPSQLADYLAWKVSGNTYMPAHQTTIQTSYNQDQSQFILIIDSKEHFDRSIKLLEQEYCCIIGVTNGQFPIRLDCVTPTFHNREDLINANRYAIICEKTQELINLVQSWIHEDQNQCKQSSQSTSTMKFGR